MLLFEDIENIINKDPAARSRLEVVLCYSGFHAIIWHRLAHFLWQTKVPFAQLLGRFISQSNRFFTGIEIHPGASLGRRVFIDHGAGIVIGETSVVGDDCVLYQGVTLGAGAEARQGALTRHKKRHPTLGQGVVVGSGGQVLGDVVIGNHARVASGSIVLKNVPDNAVVAGVPGRLVYHEGQKVEEEVPDIQAQVIQSFQDRISALEQKLASFSASGYETAMQVEISPVCLSCNDNSKPDDKNIQGPPDVFLGGAGI